MHVLIPYNRWLNGNEKEKINRSSDRIYPSFDTLFTQPTSYTIPPVEIHTVKVIIQGKTAQT